MIAALSQLHHDVHQRRQIAIIIANTTCYVPFQSLQDIRIVIIHSAIELLLKRRHLHVNYSFLLRLQRLLHVLLHPS